MVTLGLILQKGEQRLNGAYQMLPWAQPAYSMLQMEQTRRLAQLIQ